MTSYNEKITLLLKFAINKNHIQISHTSTLIIFIIVLGLITTIFECFLFLSFKYLSGKITYRLI